MRAIVATALLCLAVIAPAYAETGIASVYWEGTHTASGERLCVRCLTAAHRTLPFGTLVKVCRILSGKTPGNCIVVTINDRGPYVRGRIIDLTPAGAHALGFSGLARVTVEPLGWTPRRGDFGRF